MPEPMELPQALIENVRGTFGARGEQWLRELPMLLEDAAKRWDVRIGPAFDPLSYNYVAPVLRTDGSEAVLKLGVPHPENAMEIEALRLFDGRACARLLVSDAADGMLLIERVRPGEMLTTLAAQDDDAATHVAAQVMRALWRPAPPDCPLRTLRSWTSELDDLAAAQTRGEAHYPAALTAWAIAKRKTLLATSTESYVLHGDCHHFNILSATREPWMAIDPKGIVGERAYEIASFVYNPHGFLDQPDCAGLALRRMRIFCAALDLDFQRVLDWSIVQAVLSDWWSYGVRGGDSAMLRYADGLRLTAGA
jgi:streptomycin 6-kinase